MRKTNPLTLKPSCCEILAVDGSPPSLKVVYQKKSTYTRTRIRTHARAYARTHAQAERQVDRKTDTETQIDRHTRTRIPHGNILHRISTLLHARTSVLFAQEDWGTPRPVDVQPHAVLFADVCDRVERIVRTSAVMYDVNLSCMSAYFKDVQRFFQNKKGKGNKEKETQKNNKKEQKGKRRRYQQTKKTPQKNQKKEIKTITTTYYIRTRWSRQ